MEKYKQLDDIILQETNIKSLSRCICTTEEGDLCLVYDGEIREYFWELGGKQFLLDTPQLNKAIPEILENYYNKKNES